MARRTGREGIHTRVVSKDLDEAKRRIEEREVRDVLLDGTWIRTPEEEGGQATNFTVGMMGGG